MITLFRIANLLQRKGIPLIPRFIYLFNRIVFSIVLPATVTVGRGTVFAYQGIGVVVHAKASLGENVYVGPQVIIGGRSGEATVPIIGDRVFLGAGCRIMGPVQIGNDATVAAGAVVIADVAPGVTVAGVPAKPIRSTRKESPTTSKTKVDVPKGQIAVQAPFQGKL